MERFDTFISPKKAAARMAENAGFENDHIKPISKFDLTNADDV